MTDLDLEAERYTHSGETMQQVIARIQTERPESPHQVRLRKQREQKAGSK